LIEQYHDANVDPDLQSSVVSIGTTWNLRVSYNLGNFLMSWGTVSVSGRTLPSRISCF